ncbi:pleiotropic regulator 1 [Pectinophora gossypiella]|uniref:pleiotropic regulator 1 n=1 Tax=Pectinophora gossypiella TaxID=13191 RepID=UPI00214F3623|nr:pleiotropic regulator 1 [Pectinophora gossypiella]
MSDDVIKHSVHTLVFRSLKRSHDMFLANQGMLPPIDEKAEKVLRTVKARDSYGQVMSAVQKAQAIKQQEVLSRPETPNDTEMAEAAALGSDGAMLPYTGPAPSPSPAPPSGAITLPRKAPTMPKPKWHAPWKLFRVISGHLGWVRCVTVEPGNEWFATGAADRVIKIWDLASGKLKVSLTGHVSTVRGLEVSSRHPYLFSCGEDRQVKCWDLEYNKVIRHYHGHLSAVYTMSLHPTIDVLVTAGRDATARVWDMRTKANVHTLTGHTDTIASLACQASEPQIITGSHDSTIRLWDLAAGKSICTLTNHKKSVRSIVVHPTLYTFASASPDNIKQWKCPEGKFIQNLSGHNAIVNCMAVNPEGVLVSGGDNGTMYFWDWRTGYNFQRLQAAVQPGSMDSEAGIFAMTYDQSGSRLITTEADKTIKIYREDDTASEETHPVNWRPEILKRRKF